jgi:hypothetical protein
MGMDSKTRQTGRQRRRRRTTVTSKLRVEICRNNKIETGTWAEFSTEKFWKKITSSPRDIKVEIKLRSKNDLKPRRINVTAGHKPIIRQAVIFPDQSNKFSVETGQILKRGDKIRLKIDASRIFEWKISMTMITQEGEDEDETDRHTKRKKDSSSGSRFCLNCGSLILINAKFCHRCGVDIKSDIKI